MFDMIEYNLFCSVGVMKLELNLIKGHGSGNDFILIDEITTGLSFTDNERAELARLLCNRNSDLGADGILFAMKSDRADGKMRIFNADGSEASMCGNGLRIVARYVCELFNRNEAVIETMKADLKVKKQVELFPEVPTYQVEISPVHFDLQALPLQLDKPTLLNERIIELTEDLRFTALAVPNPHLITIADTNQLQSDLQKQISEKVNGPNNLFPDGVNVSFVKTFQPGDIFVRTYERGVGFTNACGTAMSASALVTCLLGMNDFEKTIYVYNNGGKVQCVVHQNDDKYEIDLIGNATYLYKAAISVNLDKREFILKSKNELREQISYEKLKAEAQQFLRGTMKR